jgi:hypothetical protein
MKCGIVGHATFRRANDVRFSPEADQPHAGNAHVIDGP